MITYSDTPVGDEVDSWELTRHYIPLITSNASFQNASRQRGVLLYVPERRETQTCFKLMFIFLGRPHCYTLEYTG